MCCKNEIYKFIAWLAFSFSLVNSIAMGIRFFWFGGLSDYWMNYLLWFAISGGFYIWHKLK